MNFELDDEHRMLRDLVQKFVTQELIPLEPAVMARAASGLDADLSVEERQHIPLGNAPVLAGAIKLRRRQIMLGHDFCR